MSYARVRAPSLFDSINVTPFIDVLLVLIIMLILTIPVATNKLPMDLPQQGPTPLVPVEPHVLAIDAGGGLYWDGARIPDAQLAPRLAALAKADAPLVLKPDAQTRYERFNGVLAQVRRGGVTKVGFSERFTLDD